MNWVALENIVFSQPQPKIGKKKYDKYENYVGNDEIGQEIRQYGRTNPGKSIIIQDSLTGAMLYLKKGKDHERFQNFH